MEMPMIGLDENQTIKITITLRTLRTLKKIVDVLDKDEIKNLFLSNMRFRRDSIAEDIIKKEKRLEEASNKSINRVMKLKENAEKRNEKRKLKKPKRKLKWED